MAKQAIRFRPGDIRLLDNAPEGLLPRTHVVFEVDGGIDCRPVTVLPNAVASVHGELPSAKFVRLADPTDMEKLEAKTQEEVKAHGICVQKIATHCLPMKLVDALYTLDFGRLTFLYTSEGRVDFRELLRDLTSTFRRTRIMLRQIGVRDEARHLSGVGPCGKELCCSTFIREFMPINIKLAKDQDMSLNPAKLSGACGRLKCCLTYEVEAYRAAKRGLPRQGTRVLTARGEGRILEVQAAHERALVELADGVVVILRPEEMNPLAEQHPGEQRVTHSSPSNEAHLSAEHTVPAERSAADRSEQRPAS
ncbi:MAG: regulatory iron-sulfur-containing complex subunit RicT [Candidatus Sericytochromatia bacterium]|nr:regulatory iron-sulfur-containing complex subunit RicT [Candidatus Sericytochromatia bacterium]